MDSDGKADPYIEVSLRPGPEKFTTSIKPNSLNPTFNETVEFPATSHDIEMGELVMKVMDSDFPMADELIGIIRLPLRSLDLSVNSKQHTGLILHDKVRNRHELTALDAAKLNLKISQKERQLEELRNKINENAKHLEKVRQETAEMRNKHVDLTIENQFLTTEIEKQFLDLQGNDENLLWTDPESGERVQMRKSENISISRPKSCGFSHMTGGLDFEPQLGHKGYNSDSASLLSASPEDSIIQRTSIKNIPETGHRMCVQKLHGLRERISFEDQKILQLKNYIQVLENKNKTKISRKGAIEVGLSFSHITSRLKVSILSASKLQIVNAYGHTIERLPNPYVKVKIFHGILVKSSRSSSNASSNGAFDKGSKGRLGNKQIDRRSSSASMIGLPGSKARSAKKQMDYRWSFKTKTAWDTLTPAWNEHFEVNDIAEDDLPNMYIEITVMDNHKFRPAQALGKVRIGPGSINDNQHWEEMVRHHGNLVTMTHLLEDI